MQPPAVRRGNDALGTQDGAVLAAVQRRKNGADALLGKGLGRFRAPGGKHLVGMVMVAVAMGVVTFVSVMMMVMAVVIVVVMMLVVMMVVMVVIVVVMVVAVAMGIVTFMSVMVMVMLLCLVLIAHFRQQLVRQRDLFHGGQDGLAVQLVPRGGQNRRIGILLAQQRHGGLQLLLTQLLSAGEDNGPGGLDLVIIELTEILHVNLDLAGIGHGDKAVELHIGDVLHGILHRHDHIAELAHAGGLDQNTVGVELRLHLLERFAEVAHQRAADAAGGHLADLHAAVLQKAAVNADFAKLVFDQHQLFALIGLGQQLFDQGRLTGTQKSGYNVNFCHHALPSFLRSCRNVIFLLYNSPFSRKCKGKGANSLLPRGNFCSRISYRVLREQLRSRSRAMDAHESCQAGNRAALRGIFHVPRGCRLRGCARRTFLL